MCVACIILVIVLTQTASTTDSVSFKQNTSLNSTTKNSTRFESSCYEFKPQSCSGVCGQFFQLWCSCDEYCLVYGRCSSDYQTVCKEDSEKSRQDHEYLMNVTIECDIDIPENNVPQQIVTSCSSKNASLKTAELCVEKINSSAIASKVMSKRTKLHYQNRYCMLCNGEDEDDVVYWPTVVGTTSRRYRTNNVNDILNIFQSSVRIIPPQNSREIICFPEVISFCTNDTNSDYKHLCEENPLSPIRYDKKVYKNTFCLQCADVSRNEKCSPADRNDTFLHNGKQNVFPFSMTFNWGQNKETSVYIDSPRSLIRNVSCWLDTNGNLKECTVNKCIGTQPVVNGSCQLGPDHYGCIEYIFQINFTVPENSTGIELKHLSSKLVEFAARLESKYNITRYYIQNVELRNITIVNDQIQGFISLQRMAYNLCNLDFKNVRYTQYYEYLDNNLGINLNGSISTCRYRVECYKSCAERHDNDKSVFCDSHIKFFTQNIELDLVLTSTATKSTLICRIRILCILLVIALLEVFNIY